MKNCTKETNEKLNAYIKNDYPLADNKEWTIWATKANGAAWYTVVEDGEATDDNIIEGETGELMYLSLDDAKMQWGMYKTYSRIEGTVTEIDEFPTKEKARKAVQGYYSIDISDGDFHDGIYGIAAKGEPMGVDGIILADKGEGDMDAELLNSIIHRWRMSNQFLSQYLRRSVETVKSYRYNRLAIPQEIADKMRRLHVFLAMED